jgi:hypothetical protein
MSTQGFSATEAAIADLPPERIHFKELLLANHFQLANPEGNPPEGNTTYEQLVCIGYRPQFKRLDAVVQLNEPFGYLGGICSPGSQEYVAFYSSTDGGTTWTSLGVTGFTAWDQLSPLPLQFEVSIPVDFEAECCSEDNLVLVRGVLSWEVAPAGPTSPVVWGNGLDVTVQVAPLVLSTLQELLECGQIPFKLPELGAVVNLAQVVEAAPPKQLTPVELHELYEGTNVPQHRYLLNPVAQLLDNPVALSAALQHPDIELLQGLGGIVDVGSLIGSILDPQGNETYEQLGCVALNGATDELVATIEIKQPDGFSGGLCTTGSLEYVAFWADWGAGFQYVGTTAVNVHDISTIPAGGLQYSAALLFPQALTQCQPCGDGPLAIVVRAVLSWNTPPSTTNPYAVPVWGGHLEVGCLIPPGETISAAGGSLLESIGSMPVSLISDVTGLANGPSLVAFVATSSPFGGDIVFTGHVVNPATGVFGGTGIQYQILVSTDGGATSTPMNQPIQITTSTVAFPPVQNTITVTPTPDGWYPYSELTGVLDVVGNVLGNWESAGDGQAWIQMQARLVSSGGTTALGTPTAWQLVQLDNSPPSAPVVEITTGGGSCGDFGPGDLLSGTYSTSDVEMYASVSLSVEPPMPGVTFPSPPVTLPTYSTLTTGTSTTWITSGQWNLQTLLTTTPCGYVIEAIASDNTIVDSGGIGWTSQGFAGFCIQPGSES